MPKTKSIKTTSTKIPITEQTTITKPFEKLPVSTQTVMAYLNCKFNIENIFNNLPVEDIGDQDIKKIKGEHGKIYRLKRVGQTRGAPTKKGNFRNQITAYLYIIDKIVTVKIFPTGKLHLTGCKNSRHRQEAAVELVNNIRTINSDEHPTIIMDEDNEPLNIILEVVMVNVDFHLGFDVDQRKLDQLLQKDHNDFYSIYETPINTSVNIKLDYPDPEAKHFTKIIIEGEPSKPKITFTTTTDCPKARKVDTRTHTFLVFSSSKVIQSGRYYDSEMEPAYKKFHDFIMKHRDQIELQLREKPFDLGKLKGIGSNKPLQIKLPKNKKHSIPSEK